jgi:hypothetical protein
VLEDAGRPALFDALLIARNGAWRHFRNPETGEEWKENGWRWHDTRELALRAYIEQQYPSRENRLVDGISGGPGPEARFRLMVHACALLARLWARGGEGGGGGGCGSPRPDSS